jgi:hypothetical protein
MIHPCREARIHSLAVLLRFSTVWASNRLEKPARLLVVDVVTSKRLLFLHGFIAQDADESDDGVASHSLLVAFLIILFVRALIIVIVLVVFIVLVKLFSDAQFIGDRRALLSSIVETTGISSNVFQGYLLHFFPITERLSWTKRQVTKREEDFAYSLLGIFDVYMPLIYGEGQDRAMSRLLYETDVYERHYYGRAFRVFRSVISTQVWGSYTTSVAHGS